MLCNSGELEVDVEFSCRMRQCALRPPTDGGQRLRAASLPAHASHVRTVGAVIPRPALSHSPLYHQRSQRCGVCVCCDLHAAFAFALWARAYECR